MEYKDLLLLGSQPITTNPLPDEIFVNDGPAGRWMTIPLSHEEAGIIRSLPQKARDEFKENIHKYIEQTGKDYPALTAMPLDEAPYALG